MNKPIFGQKNHMQLKTLALLENVDHSVVRNCSWSAELLDEVREVHPFSEDALKRVDIVLIGGNIHTYKGGNLSVVDCLTHCGVEIVALFLGLAEKDLPLMEVRKEQNKLL